MVTRKIKVLVSVLAIMIAGTVTTNAQETMSSKSSKSSRSGATAVPTSDAEIQKCIADRLARASSLEGQTINVAVSGGDATLTGSVKKGLQKGTASRVAKVKACGAKQVTNNLTVESTASSSKKSTAQKR
jgi:osmotically-inducible protein OsmY